MLRRKIIQTLEAWYAMPERKSLIIEGPQEIGKTFVLKTFAFKNYKQVVMINFNQFPYMRHLFEVDMDVDAMVLQMVMLIKGAVCVPHETLIIMEELEYCPSAYVAMKKFSLDKRYDCIATLSRFNFVESCAEVDKVRMHSMDFEEFLWANKIGRASCRERV